MREPPGFTLIRADGTEHNRIRGDLIPPDTLVIVDGGRYFVRTGKDDADEFWIYEEDYKTFVWSDEP